MSNNRRQRCQNFNGTCKEILQQNLLVALTLVGVGVGLFVGFMVAPTTPSNSTLLWLGMLGELYIRMLKMMIVPLVICSIIAGTAEMDPRSEGKVSGVSLLWIMGTNLLGCILGVALCLVIKPGIGLESDVSGFNRDIMETEDIFADLLRNIFPDNLVASCFEQAQTKYDYEDVKMTVNNGTANITKTDRVVQRKYLGAAKSTNILGLVIVSAVFGVASKAIGEKSEPFLNFFRASTDIIIRILRVVIWSTPVGVASLVAKTIAGTADLQETFRKLGLYFLTIVIIELLLALVIMPLVYFCVRRRNPLRFLASITPSVLIVFATASTVMALPESFYALEKKLNVDKRISRFISPLYATIGRSGSAAYISVSCIFIIQLLAMDVTVANVFLIIVLTWFSALAIPSVAGASLVTVLILLTSLNIPGESAAMLFALEFFLFSWLHRHILYDRDRARSTTNMVIQLTGVVVVQKYCAPSMSVEEDTEISEGNAEEKCALTECVDRANTKNENNFLNDTIVNGD